MTATKPPGPKGRFLTGSLREFSAQRLEFFTNLARTYGDVVAFRLGPRRVWLVNHPDLIEQVLVTDARHFIKHFGARVYRPLLGNGLLILLSLPMGTADAALALTLNRREIVEPTRTALRGSWVPSTTALKFQAFYPNAVWQEDLAVQLLLGTLLRAKWASESVRAAGAK